MQLMTKTIEKMFRNAEPQEDAENPVVQIKYFDPCGSGTWWATEYDPETRTFFGYVTGLGFNEWGYFSLDELESVTLRFGLGIERDLYFKPVPIKQALIDYYGKEV